MAVNRNIAVALLVAPLLSLLAWWAVGALTGEQPRPASEGASYPLLEKSGCRYGGGDCVLENVDFSLELKIVTEGHRHVLEVYASHPLENLLVTVGPPREDAPPNVMAAVDGQRLVWRLRLARAPRNTDRIRLVAHTSGSNWFGDASTIFTLPPGQAHPP